VKTTTVLRSRYSNHLSLVLLTPQGCRWFGRRIAAGFCYQKNACKSLLDLFRTQVVFKDINIID